MAFHPPAQYLGYVGLSVPFAFALAALITGRVDSWWLKATRRWTLVSWGFLTLAIAAGGWWAYEVLGWGGYWAWDPVENAALMPWLVATAFLHTIMVQERREMLRGWNVSLIVAAFALTILGTFLTRSGVLGSVHAFTQSIMGPLFLGFLALVLLVSTTLILWRASLLRAPGSLDHPLSKEGAFMVSNLLLVGLTFTVLLGTVFPLVAEAVRGVKVSVGAPYFNAMTVPVLAALLFMMGVGPALPWRRPPANGVLGELGAPVAGGLATALIAALLGVRQPWPLLTMGLAGFATSVMGGQMARGTLARIRGGMGPVKAFRSLVAANRRRYGGYIVHFGVVLVAVGVAASWNYKTEREATLRPGDVLSVGDYDIRLDGVRRQQEPHRFSVIGGVSVMRKGRPAGTLEPKMNFYESRQQPIPTPAVRSAFTEDLFMNLVAYEQDGSTATFKVIVTPLVAWLWLGSAVMAMGTVVAVWPGRRRVAARAPGAAGNRAPPALELEEVA
jgi:cytochrome c-type biogenesis protein CcmF